MNEILARNWRLVAFRGYLSLLFGLSIIVWQGLTLNVLVVIFGVYVLLNGSIAVGTGLAHAGNMSRSRIFLLEGLINLTAGVIALTGPLAVPLAIMLLIGSWAILTGILQTIAGVSLRREIRHERLLVFGGLASFILGTLLFGWPNAGIVATLWAIGVYTQIFGALMVFLGSMLKDWQAQRSSKTRPV